MFRIVGKTAVALALLAVCAPCTNAQPVSLSAYEPDLTNPGARSLGLGGAFVALADDATAAFANPAGLTQLVRPELSAEIRATNLGFSSASSTITGLGFASFVYPWRDLAFAVYGHTLANVEQSLDVGVTPPSTSYGISTLVIANLGASAAWSVSDSLSLGLGVTSFNTELSAFGTIVSPFNITAIETSKSQSQVGGVAGLRWRADSGWSIGAAYRSGAAIGFDLSANDLHTPSDSTYEVQIPAVAALGAAWRTTSGGLVLTAEWEHLRSDASSRHRVHAGAEWLLLHLDPLVAFRFGLWHDPSTAGASPPISAWTPRDDDALHGSIGLGLVFRRFQLDIAYDHSDRLSTGSLSAIFYF